MMKTYEILAVSSVSGCVGFQDGVFFFEVEAASIHDAYKRFDEMRNSPELARKKLRMEHIETKAERLARCAQS